MRQEVAAFTAACEKYVGTESGGMDQAISIMGQKGLAKLVHFKPVRARLPCSILPLPNACDVRHCPSLLKGYWTHITERDCAHGQRCCIRCLQSALHAPLWSCRFPRQALHRWGPRPVHAQTLGPTAWASC